MKQVLLIATGGTIACRETENGLSPTLTGAQLLELCPNWDRSARSRSAT